MTTDLLLTNAILVLVYMTAFFVVARLRHRLDTVDTAWGGGFVLLAWLTYLQRMTSASLVIALLVTVWGARLALHISQRSSKHTEDDPRYTAMAEKWKGKNYWLRAYLSIFVLQGVLIVLVGLPIMTAAGVKSSGAWLTLVGGLVWLGGFVFEAIADKQLANFLAAGNKGRVLQTGLWHYSRHPNYFGEIVQWLGIALIACQAAGGWLGLLGPALLAFLIVYISGIPPIEKRRKDDPAYQDYKRHTSALVPLPPK